jgi:hypothetical protein
MKKSSIDMLVYHGSDLLLDDRAFHLSVPEPERHGRYVMRRIEEAAIK